MLLGVVLIEQFGSKGLESLRMCFFKMSFYLAQKVLVLLDGGHVSADIYNINNQIFLTFYSVILVPFRAAS